MTFLSQEDSKRSDGLVRNFTSLKTDSEGLMPVFPAFGRWSWENQKFKASFICRLSSSRPRLHETRGKKKKKNSTQKLKIIF